MWISGKFNMKFKNIIILILIIFLCSGKLFAEDKDSAQTENKAEKITLSGYGEKGEKRWDLNSETADVNFEKNVKLVNPDAVLYKDGNVDVKLKAKEGEYDRSTDNVHLRKDVVVEEKLGAVMQTNSVQWNAKTSLITSNEQVRITRENAVLTGDKVVIDRVKETGEVKENVKIKSINADEKKHPTIITCEGKMVVKYQNYTAEFYDNVVVADTSATLKADYIRISLNDETLAVESVYCKGHVFIVQGDKRATSNEAVYNAVEGTIVLTEDPKLMKSENLLGADKIIFFIKDERVVCEPKARLIIYPSEEDKKLFEL